MIYGPLCGPSPSDKLFHVAAVYDRRAFLFSFRHPELVEGSVRQDTCNLDYMLPYPPLERQRKTGQEALHCNSRPLGLTLADFWGWSVSDLVSNATRGRFAEFIVANALKIPTDKVRDEWGAFDLKTTSGLKIEVKSAAYVQTWSQRKLSSISFLTPKSRAWDPETNLQSKESRRQANVYVFALLAHQDKQTIDPLNVAQWKFYVLPTTILDGQTRSQSSITLKTLEKLSGGPVSYQGLGDAVNRAISSQGGTDPSTSSG